MKIFEELLTRISLRQPVVLCTVIETDRSVPRKAGAKMLVHEDGSTYGTIGGGEMESRVIHAAKESIKAKFFFFWSTNWDDHYCRKRS
jgi:xanthine dehydrogenase accessory factor